MKAQLVVDALKMLLVNATKEGLIMHTDVAHNMPVLNTNLLLANAIQAVDKKATAGILEDIIYIYWRLMI